MAKLATDLDNTDFVGARNPDDQLWVRFESRKHHLVFKSDQEGHNVYEMRDYITIQIPGDSNNVIDREVIPHDKARFPRQWAYYQNTKQSGVVEGWAIETWPLVNAAQVEELKYRKCYTVEQLANMPDNMVQNMGMGYMELKTKAQIALKHARDGAEALKYHGELEKRDKQLADQATQLATLQAQLAELMKKSEKPAKVDK